jgi:hypothetical protein
MFKTSLWESCYERCRLNLAFTNFVLVQLGAVKPYILKVYSFMVLILDIGTLRLSLKD